MIRTALKMLAGDRAKYAALLFGIAFTAFLVNFAASFFCGMMTRGFALVAENPAADVWVMDPAVLSPERTANLPAGALARVRSVRGVAWAVPLLIASADVRFPDVRFQPVEIIGVDDATLMGEPPTPGSPAALRAPDAAVAADGGTEGKLLTPADPADPAAPRNRWRGSPRPGAPLRPLAAGDVVLVNDARVRIVARADSPPRFPARPLLYMTYSNALRVLPRERARLTFVLAHAAPGAAPRALAARVGAATGLRARSSADLEADTVRWLLLNSEDVGDAETMLVVAVLVGLGTTGVMFYLFTQDNLRHYAVLKAMGAGPRVLLAMLLAQGGLCAAVGAALGVGLCAAAGPLAAWGNVPFRMMWYAPLAAAAAVAVVALSATAASLRPVLKLEPATVFAGR